MVGRALRCASPCPPGLQSERAQECPLTIALRGFSEEPLMTARRHNKKMKIPSDRGDRPKARGGFNSGKLSQLGTHPHRLRR
jgi:hypothetical protein